MKKIFASLKNHKAFKRIIIVQALFLLILLGRSVFIPLNQFNVKDLAVDEDGFIQVFMSRI